ncbi:16S rRNA (uracil(1498)-N(3))-methyltransferase [Bacillus methanolicus]|uniref:Ribosomal RNA small subunit methyltransferase E n=1 Tax=Bacillus methanolicus (strain MGA3 / ATCC 53907) TaxID=796606 RepID=I3EAN7_BACMM|nr:16S rRNA (uracil(1498)-N(3))-methyltransferase [Bacillus methanolicus]AIE60797.1 Ribosomal RNA small subunit methyltransferase E [Bacillus methanolicus MGA3]EIJ83558.1 16S ribosomal RNA methyltransferase RsmE [Bacillus methanolicus MGA3]UQD52804.1 16S rRNA (uracil(1498)-N(3))-methyltransferase [Bacillus methanolicus]
MQRYFVSHPAIENRFSITGDDLHHIVRVMRMKEGDRIVCVGPDETSAVCEIAEITDEQVIANVVQWMDGTSELPVRVAIASGLPKGDKFEWIIQKGTELGAWEFIPFTATRSVVKWDVKKASRKVERWNKIAKEASEQSHRQKLPEVLSPVSFTELINLSKKYDNKLVAFEEDAKQRESSVLSKTLNKMERGESILFVFGPEGGLSEEEVLLLKENGFKSCGLGPRILRTETAPLYALSAVSYHFELLG